MSKVVDKKIDLLSQNQVPKKENIEQYVTQILNKTENNLKKIISCKCDYLLTSGQKENVDLGLKNISKILKQVNHQIKIIAGGGVNIKNVENLYKVGVREFHLLGTDKKKAKPLETNYKLIKEVVDKLKLIKK